MKDVLDVSHLDLLAVLDNVAVGCLLMHLSKWEKEQSKVLAMSAALVEFMQQEIGGNRTKYICLEAAKPILQICRRMVALLSTAQLRVVVPFVHCTRFLMF